MKSRVRMDVLAKLFGDLGEVHVSLSDSGRIRLIDETHAQVNQLRALRGLPPHDFSKRLRPDRRWGRSRKTSPTPNTRKAANA